MKMIAKNQLYAAYQEEIRTDLRGARTVEDLNYILTKYEAIMGDRIDGAMFIVDHIEWDMVEHLNDIYDSFVFISPDNVVVVWSDYTRKFEVLELEK
jgi:hypothetical protein